MGTEAAWVPLAVSALSTAAAVGNQQYAKKRQEDEATNMMVGQQRKQNEVDSRLNSELANLQDSGPDAERQKALDGFLQQLRANAGNANGSTGVPSTASDRFNADSQQATADIQNYGTGRADILSRLEAPGLQRRREGVSIARAGDDVSGIARNAEAERFLSQLKMQSIQPNPWVGAAAQVGQGAASSMASGWGNAASTGPSSTGNFGATAAGASPFTRVRPVSAGLAPR